MKKRFLVIIATVVMALALIIPMATPALAGPGSPAGANSNDLSLALSVVPNLTYNGATVGYYMSVSNPINPTPGLITADAIGIVVSFYPPGPNGLPVAVPTYVSAPFNLAAGGATVSLPTQNAVINLNPGVVNAVGKATFSATLITFPQDSQVTGEKNIPLTIINNVTTANITASASQVPPGGGNVVLTITDHNGGNVPLTSPSVDLTSNVAIATLPMTLIKTSPSFVSGDANSDGVLDPGETWRWDVTVFVDKAVTFTEIGHGLDPMDLDVTYPGVSTERAQVSLTMPPTVPGLSNLGIGLMIGGFATAITFFVLRRTRRSPQAS